jgi:hypothetical protein
MLVKRANFWPASKKSGLKTHNSSVSECAPALIQAFNACTEKTRELPRSS